MRNILKLALLLGVALSTRGGFESLAKSFAHMGTAKVTRRRRPISPPPGALTPANHTPTPTQKKGEDPTQEKDPLDLLSEEQGAGLLFTVLRAIKTNGVKASSAKEIPLKDLLSGALNGMLSTQDPHSGYFTRTDFRKLMEGLKGEFGGLGIEMTMRRDGSVQIISPIDDTPAFRAGIQKQDIILAVDGKPLYGLSLMEVADLLKGKPGTKIELLLKREGVDKPISKALVRALISIKSVKGHAENDVAYIRISTFDEHTTELLKKIKQDLDKQIGPTLKGYVLDMRSNPGGLVEQAISVSSLFIEEGIVVSMIGRTLEQSVAHKVLPGQVIFKDLPVVLLIDSGSASASEIVAGALQDHKKAILLGDRSFGKGSIQQIIPLGAEAMYGGIKLTVARFYRPNGEPIHGYGITPDLRVPQLKTLPEEDFPRLREANLYRTLTIESVNGSAPPPPASFSFGATEGSDKKEKGNGKGGGDSEKPEDYQLARALDHVRVLFLSSPLKKEKPVFKEPKEILQTLEKMKEKKDKKEK